MGAFIDDGVLDSGETVEYHGTAAAFDIVDGGLGKGQADGEGDSIAGDGGERASHNWGLKVEFG